MTDKQDGPRYPVVTGLEFYSTDGGSKPPKTTALREIDIEDWSSSPSDAAMKILSIRLDSTQRHPRRGFSVPFSPKIVETAIWRPEVYYNLAQNPGGGAAGLIDEPPRFILQTPSDHEPFCSLAMSKKGTVVKGIYSYTNDSFEPTSILAEELSPSSWRQSGLQIINLPQAILRQHSNHISNKLTHLLDQIEHVESTLATATTTQSFSPLITTLHTSHLAHLALQRRSRFESTLLSAISTLVSHSKHAQTPWPALSPQTSALEARAFDLDFLPGRISNARATISALIQHRNEERNLEIAEASRRMAAFALSDNASMKTIAIMTMVFLPGTAVASFFSMSMFDWGAQGGGEIASRWLWVFFVVAVPLSAAVVGVWWVWTGRMRRGLDGREWVGKIGQESGERNDEFELRMQQEQVVSVLK
ncbi:hypothetical protein M409DRAFT_27489 [Zasmidium cellare ATCC 36951]|uniref:Uncharacterized protein n=1 Tax=Zasmidium cellare ATCC 36951 TaxID=1080233 RepID=A0A6A6C778_ZASCE|nr:uncharacterized protein M409DRAFT_27489 [Zasmidium cellare ATCC 36951]KAF2162108.1 hypothetical protein M409DRAFT_27489 [Zasmidium cellare ATCC 36951]